MPVLATTTDTSSLDDEDTHSPTYINYHVNVKGEGNCAIGPKAQLVTNAQRDSFNARKVLEDFNRFLQEIASFRGPEKDRMECFVLTEILPYIESHAIRNGGNCNDALEILARLSLPTLKAPRIAKHALKLLDKFVAMDIGKGITNAHLIATEKCLRKPIVDGSFREELLHDQRRRMDVYCNVLTAILIGRANEHLSYPYQKGDKEEIATCQILEIEKILRQWPLPTKYRKRLSLESILSLLERLLHKKRMHKRLKKLLDKCELMLKDGFDEDDIDSFLQEVSRIENGDVDLFIIVKMLHAKINDQPRAYQLFKNITKSHPLFSLSWNVKRERDDWRFALLACRIFVDVTINHNIKATRIDAANCLANFCNTKAYKKSVVVCAIVEKYITKAVFAFDAESRRILLETRYADIPQEKLPLELLRKTICASNQSGYLEISDTLSENDHHVIMRGRYTDNPAAVKAIAVPVSKLFTAQNQEPTPAEIRMENEVSVCRYLNSEANDYVPVCYATDTNNLPYHMVMEHAQNGDLLSYLKHRRERNPPSYREVLQICLASAKAMEFVHKKKVVHSQLRAEHLLAGQSYECIKVTGFSRARQGVKDNEFYRGECLGKDDPSVRWTAPDGLRNPPKCSFKTDTWSFGVSMYEFITCGGLPYADKTLEKVKEDVLAGRYLSKEKNMKDGYYSLMQRCFGEEQISFTEICRELQRLIQQCVDKDDRPLPIPENIPTIIENGDSKDLYQDLMATYDKPRLHNKPAMMRFTIRQAQLKDDSEYHVNKLKTLDNPFLVKVIEVKKRNNATIISFEHFSGQSLGDHLKDHCYTVDDLTRFCAQICSAVNYLHSQNIVHCNITLDNIVIVNGRHVKLSGLQYTRSLRPFHDNVNSPICTTHGLDIQPHMYRWHAQEVIQEGIYSKESDIWSLGMLMWAIFCSLELEGQDVKQDIKPFPQYEDIEILHKLKIDSRPFQTFGCPDWLYIVMTQCWLHRTSERASSLSILECLTHRTPWETYTLQNWLKKHSNEVSENWPNLNINQRCADEFISPSREDVMDSISEEFAADHNYEYEPPQWSLKRRFQSFGKNIKDAFRTTRSSSSQSHYTSWKLPSSFISTNQTRRSPPSLPQEEAELSSEMQEVSLLPPPVPERKHSQTLSIASMSSRASRTSLPLPALPDRKTDEVITSDSYEEVDKIYKNPLFQTQCHECHCINCHSKPTIEQEDTKVTDDDLYNCLPNLDISTIMAKSKNELYASSICQKTDGGEYEEEELYSDIGSITDVQQHDLFTNENTNLEEENAERYQPMLSIPDENHHDVYALFYQTPSSTLSLEKDPDVDVPLSESLSSTTLPVEEDVGYTDVVVSLLESPSSPVLAAEKGLEYDDVVGTLPESYKESIGEIFV